MNCFITVVCCYKELIKDCYMVTKDHANHFFFEIFVHVNVIMSAVVTLYTTTLLPSINSMKSPDNYIS